LVDILLIHWELKTVNSWGSELLPIEF